LQKQRLITFVELQSGGLRLLLRRLSAESKRSPDPNVGLAYCLASVDLVLLNRCLKCNFVNTTRESRVNKKFTVVAAAAVATTTTSFVFCLSISGLTPVLADSPGEEYSG